MGWWDAVAEAAGTSWSYTPPALLASALPGVTREDIKWGVASLYGGDLPDDRFAQSWADAGRQTVGDLTPDYFYLPPTPRPGPDGPGQVFPQGLIPDAWEDPLKDAGKLILGAAALVAALALRK